MRKFCKYPLLIGGDDCRNWMTGLCRTSEHGTMPKLSEERFACANVNGDIRIIDRNGNAHNIPCGGNSNGKIYVNDQKIVWHCGKGGAQDWKPEPGTDYIIVTRAANGAGVVEYYSKD